MIDPAKVASDINAMLKLIELPFPVVVNEEDIRAVADGCVVSKAIGDVHVSVTIGPDSLSHMAMATGVLAALGRK